MSDSADTNEKRYAFLLLLKEHSNLFDSFLSITRKYSRLIDQATRVLDTEPDSEWRKAFWKRKAAKLLPRLRDKALAIQGEFRLSSVSHFEFCKKLDVDAGVLIELFKTREEKLSHLLQSVLNHSRVLTMSHAFSMKILSNMASDFGLSVENDTKNMREVIESTARAPFLPKRERRKQAIVEILQSLPRNSALMAKELCDRLPKTLRTKESSLRRHELAALKQEGKILNNPGEGYYLASNS